MGGMSDMVERVARALRECDCDPMHNDEDYANMAYAAIAAMREPTEAMIAKSLDGKAGDYLGVGPKVVTAVWQAMIDAALEGE